MKDFLRVHRFDFFILLFLFAFITIQFLPNLIRQETIAIAIAAPIGNTNETTRLKGQEMIDSVQLYFDKINAEGGIQGKRLKLQVYDDRAEPELAVKVAEEIVESSAVAVLGHSTSETSLAAGEIYQKYGIPAITGNATANRVTESEWYFRTIFNNSDQGEFIANYINYIFAAQNIYLIYADTLYSKTLKNAINNVFNTSKNILVSEQRIDRHEAIENVSQRIIQDLLRLKETEQEPDVIIMATQTTQSAHIISQLRLNQFNYPIFGGDSLANVSLATQFSDTPQEIATPGFFTNKLHSISPVLFDIADRRGQNFKNEFYQRYEYNPGWIATLYYDAAHGIVQAIKNNLMQSRELNPDIFTGKQIKRDRDRVRQGLMQINSPETAIQGITRKFYFDEKGDTSASILMGVFRRRNFISAFVQLSPIDNLDLVADLEEQLQKEEIVKIDNHYLQKTNIIYTGVDINEVNNIDEKNSSYLIDFYLWFKYEGDIHPENIEFINYDVDRLDSGERLTLGEPIKFESDRGFNHAMYQMKADFYEKFDFHNYPFDRQTLSIRFQHYNLTRDRIIYVLDLAGTYDFQEDELIDFFEKNQVFGNITDWHIRNINFYQNTDVDESTLGYESLIDTDSQFEFSQFNVEIEIERDILSFSIKNLLPLWFFTFVAYSLIFLPFDSISVEAIGGVLLAVVFYHLSLLESLPDGVGYVVALDYAFYLLYFLIGLQLLLVILGHSKKFQATGIQNYQLVRFGKIAFPMIWFIGCLIWYWIYG